MLVYNHEKYIEQSITGVLMQQTDFPVRLNIFNDKSTDNTDAVIKKIVQNQQSSHIEIRYYNHEQNMGMMANSIFALKVCDAQYISVCEGDDYWTDPLKLQKQVTFLDHNPDYNLAVGRYQFLYEETGKLKNNMELFDINKPLSLKNYLAFNFAHTSTFLYRNGFQLPDWFGSVFAGDQSIVTIVTKDAKIKYFPDFFSVYRITGTNATSTVKAEHAFRNTKSFLETIDAYTGKKYHLLINNRKRLNRLYYYFESAPNSFIRNVIRVPIIMVRWLGINVLVKFVKA